MIHKWQKIFNRFSIAERDAFHRAATSVLAHIPFPSCRYINLCYRYWEIRSSNVRGEVNSSEIFMTFKLHNDN